MKSMRKLVIIIAMLPALPVLAGSPSRANATQAKVLPIKGDKIVCDKPIVFKSRTAKLLPESMTVLASVAATLETHMDILQVEIGVHTDSRGSSAYNQAMTQKKADTILKSLVNMGVKPKRLKAVGYGEQRPIDTNRTAQGREHNRRVEFVIKSRTKK